MQESHVRVNGALDFSGTNEIPKENNDQYDHLLGHYTGKRYLIGNM